MICTSAHANAYAHSFQDPMLMSLPMLMFVLIYNLMLKLLPMLMPRPAGSCSFHNLIHEHIPIAHAPVPAHAHTQADVHSLDPPPHPHSDLKRAGGIVWAGRADYGCRWQITHGQSGGHNHKGKNLKSFSSSLSSSYGGKGFESHSRM